MLQNLHIKNIVLIDNLDVNFEEGLNILTGETGAGKSIIIGSLSIGLGGRFQKELLRNPDMDGLVELSFYIEQDHILDTLKEMEIPVNENRELIISRRLTATGRSVNRINDMTVTTTKLQEVSGLLVDLHAQHEQQTLLKADKHLAILDRFGGKKIEDKKLRVKELYTSYSNLNKELELFSMDEQEKNKKIDFLTFQINEIETARLVAGEDELLEEQYKKADNSKDILETAGEIYRETSYDNRGSAAEIIGHAVSSLGKLAEIDSDLSNLYDSIQDIDSMLSDFNRGLADYMSDMTFDEETFFEITNRLNVINTLKSKYGRSIEDILSSLSEFKAEYDSLMDYEAHRESLLKELDKATKALEKESKELSDIRQAAAKELCKVIKESLLELNFANVELDMKFEDLEHFSSNGIDKAYFMISTNIGEPMRPLYQVASGGELSRVMLAIKSTLAYEDDTPTLLFDEIDVGISGRTAQKVAEKLSVIGNMHQVICITHLPQIAAMADTHYLITKDVVAQKTITTIVPLNENQIIEEIARLIGGATINDTTMENARDIKALADMEKSKLKEA